MSDRPNISTQGVQVPEELRQNMLDQIHVGKKVIEELSDEELEMVAGASFGGLFGRVASTEAHAAEGAVSAATHSTEGAVSAATHSTEAAVLPKTGGGSNTAAYGISAAGGIFGPSLTSLTGH